MKMKGHPVSALKIHNTLMRKPHVFVQQEMYPFILHPFHKMIRKKINDDKTIQCGC